MNPNLEMQVNKTNAGLYTVTYGHKEAPLDVQEAAFAANNIEIVSPAQLGFLRAKEGMGTFKRYSRTNADVFYDDRTYRVVIVPNAEISKKVGIFDLVDAHREGGEYAIPLNQKERVYALVDEMIRNDIAFIAPHGETRVQTSDFDKHDLTSRLFSDKSLGIEAQEYGDWMKFQGRTVNIFFMDGKDYSKAQKAPYLNRLRAYGPDCDFGADGNGRSLLNYLGAFGVRFEKAAEGGKKK